MTHTIVATDLDLTITDRFNVVSDKTKQVINDLNAKGIDVVIATGRPLASVRELAETLNVKTIVGYNGGITYDVENNKVISMSELVDYEKVCEICDASNTKYLMYGNQYSIANNQETLEEMNKIFNVREKLSFMDIGLEDFLKHNKILKIIIFSMDGKIQPVWEKLEETGCFELAGLGNFAIEVTTKGVTKWQGIDRYCKQKYQGNAKIYCIGDESNDVEMITKADVGIAMGNAVEAAKKNADFITDTFANDGFAKYFRENVL